MFKKLLNHMKDPTTLRGVLVVGSAIGVVTLPQADAIFAAVSGLVGLYAAVKPKKS